MAQYQILARKLLGLPGTGPKQNLEDKSAVTTTPRVRRTAAARRCPPPALLQCHRAHATVPPCARYSASVRAGSDQIHRESGTSTVGGGRSPDLVHEWKHDSFFALEELTNLTRTKSPRRRDRNESNHVSTGGGGRHGGRWAAQGRSAVVRE
ncbi:hypothetical protein F511_30772 [Dorcoceras hygrometricum]|uniref:Uncharacterized protein n=1 Tax=Dorcoceras hygrometricum TaxID=472368 RepID=A0A2Z7BTB7_9LAMI|nr:hypothetical protein F511_30772 [Dorcoceras hygrometricum]